MLLAIDTSAGTSVAIVDSAGVVRSERGEVDPMRHAEVIGRLIADCLAEAGVTAPDITGVVAGMGPGPFTGLRVGIAAARVFALGVDRPLLALASHDAVASAHYDGGRTGRLIVTTDARRRELFWSRYSGLDAYGVPVRTAGPGLMKPAELDAERGSGEPTAPVERIDTAEIPAARLGIIAARLIAAGRRFEPDEALYLRSPDVTPPSGPKRVTR